MQNTVLERLMQTVKLNDSTLVFPDETTITNDLPRLAVFVKRRLEMEGVREMWLAKLAEEAAVALKLFSKNVARRELWAGFRYGIEVEGQVLVNWTEPRQTKNIYEKTHKITMMDQPLEVVVERLIAPEREREQKLRALAPDLQTKASIQRGETLENVAEGYRQYMESSTPVSIGYFNKFKLELDQRFDIIETAIEALEAQVADLKARIELF
jgi:hypothetical protein